MSDASNGPGWWIASDGKWYPPHVQPGYPAPPAQIPAEADQTSETIAGPETASGDVQRKPSTPAGARSVVVLGVALAPVSGEGPPGPDEYRVTFQLDDRRFVIDNARGAVLQFAKLIGASVDCVGEPGGQRLVVLLDPDGGQQCTGASTEDNWPVTEATTAAIQPGEAPMPPATASPPAVPDSSERQPPGAEWPTPSVAADRPPRPEVATPVVSEAVTAGAERAFVDTGIIRVVRPVPLAMLDTGEIPVVIAPPKARRRRRFPIGTVVLIVVAVAAIGGIAYYVRYGSFAGTSTTTTTTGPLRPGVVPVLVGEPWLTAVSQVKQVGLTVTLERGVSSAPVGEVYRQQPAGGSHLATGSAVVVSVSNGPKA